MGEKNHQSPSSESSIARFWERIPIIVQAIVVGFLIFAIVGSVALMVIMILIPAPWSILAMAIVLWFYLRYFSGSWWPKATIELRKARFRATKLPFRVWRWSIMMDPVMTDECRRIFIKWAKETGREFILGDEDF